MKIAIWKSYANFMKLTVLHPLQVLILICVPLICWTQPDLGKVVEGYNFQPRQGKSINYSVYFPPGYDSSERSYPVVYLLHGYTDNETAWVQFGEIDIKASKAIREGIIPPMLIVMPDARVTWYVDKHDGSDPYESNFINEFIPHIEQEFRIRKEKRYRGIAGLSMGGYGALLYSLKHPDLFCAAAPLSAAIYAEEDVVEYDQERWDRIEAVMYGSSLKGQERITDHWKANNPFYIVKAKSKEDLSKVRYYFDCGDSDFLYKGNALFHVLLMDKNIDHEFRMRDGGHSWGYWRTGIINALQFIGESFHQK